MRKLLLLLLLLFWPFTAHAELKFDIHRFTESETMQMRQFTEPGIEWRLAQFVAPGMLSVMPVPSSTPPAPCSGTNYYVSNSGSDSNNGTSTGTPWQTIAKVNTGPGGLFQGGNCINFNGGQTFTGNLTLASGGNVGTITPANPIVIQSYGTGRATLQATTGGGDEDAAVRITDINSFTFRNLIVRPGSSPPRWCVDINGSSGGVVTGIDVGGCTALTLAVGHYSVDILIRSSNAVTVSNNTVSGIAGVTSKDDTGINADGMSAAYSIIGNTILNIGGRTGADGGANGTSGNGITTNNNGNSLGTVFFNLIHDTGANTNNCGGPSGILAYNMGNLTVSSNEVYNIRPLNNTYPGSGCDWDGIDLDGGVLNSIVEYNYTHNNGGAGLLAFMGPVDNNWGPNTYRYNISENDLTLSQLNGFFGAVTFSNEGGALPVLRFYNNTIYNSLNSPNNSAISITSATPAVASGSIIANNMIITTGNNKILSCNLGNFANITFRNNGYYTSGGSFSMGSGCGGSTSTSLSAWATASGETGATTANPVLFAGVPAGTCTWTPSALNGPQPCPTAYQPLSASYLGTGANLVNAPFSLNVGTRDYYGNPIPNGTGTGYNIGAYGGPPGASPPATLGFFIGMNLAGGDFNCGAAPGCLPSTTSEDYFRAKNIMTIRLPVRWESLQPTLGSALDPAWLTALDALISHANSNGQRIVFDVHSFGNYNGIPIGQPGGPTPAQFADLWSKLSLHYKTMLGIYAYDLMNEPCCGITLADWQNAAQLATNAIRATGDTHLILVEGIGYSAAPEWNANNLTLLVTDPMVPRSLAYDAHAYGDADNSGTYLQSYTDSGVTASIMATRMAQPIGWANTLSRGPMIHGEGGVPYYDPNWTAVLANFLAYMQTQNEPVLYWADGAFSTAYSLNPSPTTIYLGATIPAAGVRDRDQMAVFTQYTGAAQPATFYCGGPARGPSGLASGNFVCKFEGNLTSNHTITPSDGGGGGAFSPATGTLTSGTFNPFVNFTYTPASAGTKTISFSDGGGLTQAMGSQSYVSVATAGLSAFEQMPGTVLFAWAPYKLISTYSATGNALDVKRASDNTTQTFAFSGGILNQAAITTFCTATTCAATKLYDQSGNGNHCVPFAGRASPPVVVNGQNSLLTLSFGSPDAGCASPTVITGLAGASIFAVAKVSSTSTGKLTNFADQWSWPSGTSPNTTTSPMTNIPLAVGMTDTTAYHDYGVNIASGDFNNFFNSFVDGATFATGPSNDQTIWPTHTLDVGFNRNFSPDGFFGFVGQLVVVGGYASAGDISRESAATIVKWATPGAVVCQRLFYDDFSGGYATNWNIGFPWEAGVNVYKPTYVQANPTVSPLLDPFTTSGSGLTIGAKLTNGVSGSGGKTWYTGLLTSKFTRIFGYYEYVSAMPLSPGSVNGANWIYPISASGNAEIDVIEHQGNFVMQTVWDGSGTNPTHDTTLANVTTLHTYGADWQPDFVTFYIDGTQTFQTPTPSNSKDVPMQVVLSVNIGTPTSDSTTIPQFMTVKNVGVYTNKAARDACP